MGGRYEITGVQLGMLLSCNELKKSEEVEKLLKKIIDEQYMSEHTGVELISKESVIKYPKFIADKIHITTNGTSWKTPLFCFTGIDTDLKKSKITIQMNRKIMEKLLWDYVASDMRADIYDLFGKWFDKK